MRKRLSSPVTAVLLCAAMGLASGCGSTVQQAGTRTVDPGLGGTSTGGDAGLGTTGETATSGTGATTGTTSLGGTTSGGTGGTGAATGTGSTGFTTGAGTGAAGGSTGSGVRVTRPLSVGVALFDYSALAASFGVTAGTGDQFAAHKNLINHINLHGGLAGRRVVADYYKLDGAAASQANEVQKACTHFTQDKPAEMVLTVGVNNVGGFAQCLLKKGIPQFDSGQYIEDAAETTKTPNQFANAALAHDLMASTLMDVAVARGWLTKKDVLGVVTQDCAVDNRVYARQIQPAMQAAGIKVVRATTNCIRGNADIGAAASQVSSAVLRFRSEGVTQVTLIGAPEGAAVLLFAQSANQQRYYPGYLLTSNAFAYDNSNSTWPKEQLTKMRGIGFTPILDVGLQAQTTPRQTKAQATCRAMDKTLGGAQGTSQPTNGVTFFYAICDSLRLLEAMLTASSGSAGLKAFTSTYPRAAASLPSAKLYDGTFATERGRRDGAKVVVPFSYKANGCQCMSFDFPAVPVS